MDLQIKYWNREIESELDDLILDFFKHLGYKCYGMGYDLHDKYREIVFNHIGNKFNDEWTKKNSEEPLDLTATADPADK